MDGTMIFAESIQTIPQWMISPLKICVGSHLAKNICLGECDCLMDIVNSPGLHS